MDILRKKGQSAEMWDKRALSYPRYSSSPDTFEAEIIKMTEEAGVVLTRASLLDVGCGSGKFTIGLAKKAGRVHGIDISGEMLRILMEDAEKEGVRNITCEKTGWEGFDCDIRYDLVFCSTTPAVRTPEDYLRVHDIARKAVIYLGWAGRKDSDITLEVCAAHGRKTKSFNDTPDLKKWLDEKKIPYKNFVKENDFERDYHRDEIAKMCLDAVADDENRSAQTIDQILDKYSLPDGRIRDRLYFRRELIIWEK